MQVRLHQYSVPSHLQAASVEGAAIEKVLSRTAGKGPQIAQRPKQSTAPAHIEIPPQATSAAQAKQSPQQINTEPAISVVTPFVMPDWLLEAAGTYFKASEVEERAVPVVDPVPKFPDSVAAAQAGSGVVRLRVFINEWGKVDDAYVESADPPYVFDEAALTAFRGAWFYPAVRQGRFVKSQKLIEVVFGDGAPVAATEPGLGTAGESIR